MVESGFLVVPAPGEATVRTLRHKVRLLAVRTLATARVEGPVSRPLLRFQGWLLEALRDRPGPVLGAIGAPDVLPHLLCVASGVTDPAERIAEAVPNLLGALASPPREAVRWDHPVRRLAVPRLGRAWTFDPPARGMVCDPAGVELRLADGSLAHLPHPGGLAPYHAVLDDLHLTVLDTHPLSAVEAHPDKAGNHVDLGGRSPGQWTAALGGALELVRLGLPTWAEERTWSLERLVPVGYEPERHLSASYREAPGIAWLTLHPEPLTLAEAIVHEAQHSKLNLLSWLDPVLHNGHSEWTESPVRPDLRPLMGVLLAVHAFVPVARMHACLAATDHPISRSPHFARRREEVCAANARGLATLSAKARPTAVGERLLRALEALHEG